MYELAINNASQIVTLRGGLRRSEGMKDLGLIERGSIGISDGVIKEISNRPLDADRVIDASGKFVMPGFIDPHTHLVFAGSREEEYSMKIQGAQYLDILKSGGGILSTVNSTREATEQHLFDKAYFTLDKMMENGTTTVETKTGYGLDKESEMKCLRVAKSLSEKHEMGIVSTFLGAHTLPPEFKDNREGYIKLVLDMMNDVKDYVNFCDVFCEDGAFTLDESNKILSKAKEYDIGIKIHSEQINCMDSASLAVDLGCTSADHLDNISEQSIKKMADSDVIGVLLPGAVYHLMLEKYAPARKMIDSGVPIAISTDYNPGSSPCFSMQEIISLSCRKMKMSPEEAICASTVNAAHAIGLGDKVGTIEEQRAADMIVVDAPNYKHLAYKFGSNQVTHTIKNGSIFELHHK